MQKVLIKSCDLREVFVTFFSPPKPENFKHFTLNSVRDVMMIYSTEIYNSEKSLIQCNQLLGCFSNLFIKCKLSETLDFKLSSLTRRTVFNIILTLKSTKRTKVDNIFHIRLSWSHAIQPGILTYH